MRVALFARVSSERQGGETKLSIPAQLRQMRDRCEREGWEVSHEFVAEGESAFTGDITKRPVLLRAVEAGERHEFDILMVHESSRFARKLSLAEAVKERLERCGVSIIDVNGRVEPKTAESVVLFQVNGVMNEYWSRKMGEHFRKQKQEAFERGLHVGDTPFGYERVGPNLPVRRVRHEADAIESGFYEYIAGASYTEVLTRWNAAGFQPHSKRGLTQFTVPGMQKIFENDFYCGYIHHLGQRRMGIHEPIISEETWAAAQTRVRRQPPRARKFRMLSGVLSCSECHGPLWLTRNGKKGYERQYYRDPARDRGLSCSVAGSGWWAEDIERQVSAVIEGMAVDKSWLRRIDHDARQMSPREGGKLGKEIEAKRRKLRQALNDEVITHEEYVVKLAVLDAEVIPVDAERVAAATEQLFSFGQLWRVLTPDRQRDAMRTVFEAVYANPKARVLSFRPWDDFVPLFQERRAWVCSLGPAGFEDNLRTHRLFTARELVAA